MATTKQPAAPATEKSVQTITTKPVTKKPTPVKPAQKKAPLSKVLTRAVSKKAPTTVKTEKPKKPKLVRDSFTIPKAEYMVLDELKIRATKLTRPSKKSELLRAGIKALASMSNAAFLTALAQVPSIKTGRPTLEK